MGVHALTQSRGRRYCANVERAGEEVVTPKFLDCIEVALALHQQVQEGLQNIAVRNATATHREFALNASADSQTFHILPHQRQSGIGGEVVGPLFDNKVGPILAQLQGERYMRAKSLISIGKSTEFDYFVTNSG